MHVSGFVAQLAWCDCKMHGSSDATYICDFDLRDGSLIWLNFGLTTCGQPQLKFYYYVFMIWGWEMFVGLAIESLQPNLPSISKADDQLEGVTLPCHLARCSTISFCHLVCWCLDFVLDLWCNLSICPFLSMFSIWVIFICLHKEFWASCAGHVLTLKL